MSPERAATRPPSILDVVRAVKSIAAAHGEISAWWYAPSKRLRLTGDRPGAGSALPVEIALAGDPSAFDAIARELSRALRDAPVRVRPYRGPREDGHLFRLLSAGGPMSARG